MKSICLIFATFLFGFNAFAETSLSEADFIADRFGNVKQIVNVLSTDLIFDDFQTESKLYKVTFEGIFYDEGNCRPSPTLSGDSCEIIEVFEERCYYMVHDLVDNTFTDTIYFCNANEETVVEDLYPVTLEDE